MNATPYGMVKRLPETGYEEAVEHVTRALEKEGFGILTEIDVKATLKKKLDLDFRPYVILGACNPQLAHQALEADGQIGLLLPCNVVVQAEEKGCTVSIADPDTLVQFSDAPGIDGVAREARERLERVLADL